MIKIKNILNESPDALFIPASKLTEKNKSLFWGSKEPTITFGYFENRMKVCPSVHPETLRFYRFIRKAKDMGIDEAKALLKWDIEVNADSIRESFLYSGRAWLDSKVISFWDYPAKEKMKKVLNDITVEYKKNLQYIAAFDPVFDVYARMNKSKWPDINFYDKDWLIEVIWTNNKIDTNKDWNTSESWNSKVIPLSEYIGSEKRSDKELAQQHILSPLLKAKRKPEGWGSTKDKSKTLNPHLNPKLKYGDERAYWGDSIIKIGKLLEIKEKKKKLYFTIGISGSGKSTYLNKHFPKNIIVNTDNIRKKITGDVSNQDMNIAIWQQAYTDLQTLLDTKGIAVLDATNTNTFYRNMALSKFQNPDIEKIALVFKASPEVSKQRIKKQIDAGIDRAAVPPEIVDKQYQDFISGYGDLSIQFDKVEVVK